MKNKVLVIFIIIIMIFLCHMLTKETYSFDYDNYDYTLFFNEDKNILTEDIKKYISDIDYIIYYNSNYELYDKLNNNYDFMVNFAIDYIVNNIDRYQDDIVLLDNYTYYDKYYNKITTNKYINIDKIYDITYKYFNVKDFIILNKNTNIINNYIALASSNYKNNYLKVKDVSLSINNDDIVCYVRYENNDSNYIYKFKNYNNVLKLENVGVSK